MTEDQNGPCARLLAPPYRVEVGPANLSPLVFGPLIAVSPKTFLSHCLFGLGIELRALAGEPRAIQTGDLFLDSQLDSFTTVWESLLLDQRVEALKEPSVNGNCDLAGAHRSITIYHTRDFTSSNQDTWDLVDTGGARHGHRGYPSDKQQKGENMSLAFPHQGGEGGLGYA